MRGLQNNKWYIAYAYRHWASTKDINRNKLYDTYEEAKKKATEMLCDDDDVTVYYRKNDKWYRWWHGEEKDELITDDEWHQRFLELGEKRRKENENSK